MAAPVIGGVQFEWDDDKAARNVDKHSVEFGDAALAYLDPNAMIEPDQFSEGESRFRLIGLVNGQLLLFVAYTEREHNGQETIRIISARKTDPHERRRYSAPR